MTVAEAKKYIKGLKPTFVPGMSKTIDMAPDARTKTKAALRVVNNAGEMAALIADQTKAGTAAPSGS